MSERKNRATVIIAFIVLSLGIYGAWLVFTQILASKNITMPSGEKKKHDTIYVKMVDSGFMYNTPLPDHKRDTVSKTIATPIPKKRPGPGSVPMKLDTTRMKVLERKLTKPIAEDLKAITAGYMGQLNKLSYKDPLNSDVIWLGTLSFLSILLIPFFTKKDAIANATSKDTDPDELTALYNEFAHQINLFRNPRKIIRFRNIANYHYYFFQKNGINDMDSLRKMMWLLLAIQKNPSLANAEDVALEEISNLEWFYTRLNNSGILKHIEIDMKNEKDRNIIIQILKLNADIGS